MGLVSRIVNTSVRTVVKPYLQRVHLDSCGLSRLRKLSELFFSSLGPSLANVTLISRRYNHFNVEEITPSSGPILGRLLYCPGGGYVCCSPKTHRNLTVRLALQARLQVHVVDYSKVPERSLGYSVLEVLQVYQALLVDNSAHHLPIFFGGDSAGGHLAISALLEAARRGLPMPSALVCLSPWTDLSCPQEGRSERDWDPLIPLDTLRAVAQLCLDEASPYDARYSPLYGDLSCLPPTLVQAVATELLYHDATRFVARAQEAGVSAHLSSWSHVPHCFQLLAPYLSKSVAALEEVTYFLSKLSAK